MLEHCGKPRTRREGGKLCALILNRFVLHHSTVALGRLLIIISAGGWMCLRTPGYYRGVIPPLHDPPFSTASHSLHYRNNLVYSVVTCGVTFYAIERLPNLIGAERWPPLPSVWARSGTPWRATHTHTHTHAHFQRRTTCCRLHGHDRCHFCNPSLC